MGFFLQSILDTRWKLGDDYVRKRLVFDGRIRVAESLEIEALRFIFLSFHGEDLLRFLCDKREAFGEWNGSRKWLKWGGGCGCLRVLEKEEYIWSD